MTLKILEDTRRRTTRSRCLENSILKRAWNCLKKVCVVSAKKKNSVALVRERTIPTERPPPVVEVSANFLRIEGCHVVSATDTHGR